MIKKQQKWIALFVALTFMWLLQVSAMPLAAANTTEQISSASAEQGPDYYEAVGYKAAPVKKKSIVPIILIGVGVVAVAAVLILVVFKSKYDIRGTWTLTQQWAGETPSSHTNEFIGEKKTGDVNLVLGGNSAKWGEYTIDGKDVSFWILATTYTGEFSDKTHMAGTMDGGTRTGTWSAVKTSDTTIGGTSGGSADR